MERHFRKMLIARQKAADTLVCVGLDPEMEKLPLHLLEECGTRQAALTVWMSRIVDATAPYASMFKPQRAHWEEIPDGIEAMRDVIDYIHLNHPDIPVFVDCKRGDIDRTQTHYREAIFTGDCADGMNYNGYMGSDTLKSLIDPAFPGRALVGLGRTSNPAAWEVQDRVLHDGRLLWEATVDDILNWSTQFGVLENAGVVMGAAHKHPDNLSLVYSSHLKRAREITGDKLWYLIPGVGTQGGFIEETIKAAYRGPGSIAINSSSGITNASSERNFAEAAEVRAHELRDEINKHKVAA